MNVMFDMGNGVYKPTEVTGVDFKFKKGDIISSLPTGKSTGIIEEIIYQNGYYWYDFTDGSSVKVNTQDKWELLQ